MVLHIARIMWFLGYAYIGLGDYLSAENTFKESVSYVKKLVPTQIKDNRYNGRSFLGLGIVNRITGNYAVAKEFLERTNLIYITDFEEGDGIRHAETQTHLGALHLAEGNIKEAETALNDAYSRYNNINHPDIYATLEFLAELELKKEAETAVVDNVNRSQTHKVQAISYLKSALKIIHEHFSVDSEHKHRVSKRLNEIGSSG